MTEKCAIFIPRGKCPFPHLATVWKLPDCFSIVGFERESSHLLFCDISGQAGRDILLCYGTSVSGQIVLFRQLNQFMHGRLAINAWYAYVAWNFLK